MKLTTRYNRVNSLISIVLLLITGVFYYLFVHLILTNKLDNDLAVEENEIKLYTQTYQKLPLPASYLDQQVSFKSAPKDTPKIRNFSNTTYFNPKENETEPGRTLTTVVNLKDKNILVTITKSRVESEDLIRFILLITLSITIILLAMQLLINRFLLKRLWQPFFIILKRMKLFEVAKMDNIEEEQTNIDEFNELNKSVNTMVGKVMQDYKDLKNFTDNASHEMMTPLAVINSKLDSLLQTETFTAQQGLLLADIYQATGRLAKLNQALLLLSKIENNLIPDIQELNLKELLESKTQQFHELFETKKIKVELSLEEKAINMSGYLADILINNLLSNAIRHNKSGGNIFIQLVNNTLTFSNTGETFNFKHQLFDRFAKSANSDGLGLGLAISKQICNLYGSKINYEHKENMHFFSVIFN